MEVDSTSFETARDIDMDQRGCCKRLRARPRLLFSLIGVMLLCLTASIIIYMVLPQKIFDQRMAAAVINISTCQVEIGPSAVTKVMPSVGFSASKELLKLPLVTYKAHIKGFTADINFENRMEVVKIGTFDHPSGIDIDSTQDLEMELSGPMTITNTVGLAQLVNIFIKQPNVTVSCYAKVDILAKIWGWLPVPFFGISIRKELTQPAFDNFRTHLIELDELKHSHGTPGELNITASATVFNPSPATMILHDPVQMQIRYPFKGNIFKMATLYVTPPLTLRPGMNLPVATVSVKQTGTNELAIRDFISKYIGPQTGFSPAGGDADPLLVTMTDDGVNTSPSPLIREATQGLSVEVNFRPKPIYFLSAITADIFGAASLPPYKINLHLLAKNPVPGVVRVKKVKVTCYFENLKGRVLYHYNHEIKKPEYDPAKYVFQKFENMTVTFPLNPLSEANFSFLFSPATILKLLQETASKKITLGVRLNLTITIGDGYEQVVPYENNALSGDLCFSLSEPKTNCGGLPLNPHRKKRQIRFKGPTLVDM